MTMPDIAVLFKSDTRKLCKSESIGHVNRHLTNCMPSYGNRRYHYPNAVTELRIGPGPGRKYSPMIKTLLSRHIC